MQRLFVLTLCVASSLCFTRSAYSIDLYMPDEVLNEFYSSPMTKPHDQKELINAYLATSPENTVENLSAKANDWREPSSESEEQYLLAIQQWLNSKRADQREKALKILMEVQPALHILRVAIREKKAQLASLRFDKDTTAETLPRLGQELQKLRKSLTNELQKVRERLRTEANLQMGPVGENGYWLSLIPHAPLDKSSSNMPSAQKTSRDHRNTKVQKPDISSH